MQGFWQRPQEEIDFIRQVKHNLIDILYTYACCILCIYTTGSTNRFSPLSSIGVFNLEQV